MVQRKEPPPRACSQFEAKTQDETRRHKGGAVDLKKKMKLERSMRAADLEGLQDSSMKPAKRSPNYMKPTSSSDARKEQQLQVPTLHPQSIMNIRSRSPKKNPKKSISTNLLSSPSSNRQSSIKKSLKGVVLNRATCSSTLRDSRFPEGLEVEPEGISLMRVCPYTYCSLNGHRHELVPPLKSFVSARRKLIKTQKSLKLKGLRGKISGKDEAEIDTGQEARSPDDFFVEIYAGNHEGRIACEKGQPVDETERSQGLNEVDQRKDALDQRSELSYEEVHDMMTCLEYVECDQKVNDAEEGETPRSEGQNSSNEIGNKVLTDRFHLEDDTGRQIPVTVDGGDAVVEVDAEFKQLVCQRVVEISDPEPHRGKFCSTNANDLKESDDGITEHDQIQNYTKKFFKFDGATEDASISSDIQSSFYDEQTDESDTGESWESENEEQKQASPREVSLAKSNARTKITRKKITEEPDENREFNPRAPRFLEVEPDQEAEKVDLRHQMMDERKNSEDYLIDCALQRAVMKLAPARKKKVELLVEAFETVTPLPAHEKPEQNPKSGLVQARIMQACS